MKGDILKARVNSIIGILFVGSFALWASMLIWQAAFDESPLTNVFVKYTLSSQIDLDKQQ